MPLGDEGQPLRHTSHFAATRTVGAMPLRHDTPAHPFHSRLLHGNSPRMSCDIFPYKATPQQPRPKPLRVYISCCTVDDGLSCDRGGWRSVPLLCGISHTGAPDARSADLKYRVLVPPATAHTTLAASPLRSTNEAARRLVSLHYAADGRQSSRRNPWHIPPFRSSSAISHTAHENPSLAALANTRQTSKILHGIATKDFTALRAFNGMHFVPEVSRHTFPSMSYKSDMAGNKCRLDYRHRHNIKILGQPSDD